jgi:hypothetical protein
MDTRFRIGTVVTTGAKGFFFVKTEEGETVFCHMAAASKVLGGAVTPRFGEYPYTIFDKPAAPRVNVKIALELRKVPKGLAADAWALHDEWQRVATAIESQRPEYKVCRYSQRISDASQHHESDVPAWQGKDLAKACEHFPRHSSQSGLQDELGSYREHGCKIKHHWYVKYPGEGWQQLDYDPRPVATDNSAAA